MKGKGADTLAGPITAETLAAQYGVSEKTIRRDGKRAEAIEKLAETQPEQAQLVRDGGKGKTRSGLQSDTHSLDTWPSNNADKVSTLPERTDPLSSQVEQSPTNTAATLGKIHGVSKHTIINDGKRAEAIEKLAETQPEQARGLQIDSAPNG